MTRKVIKTIKINNGTLTYEEDKYGHGKWYRNGVLITNPNYKFYDSDISSYRTVEEGYDHPQVYIPFIKQLIEKNAESSRDRKSVLSEYYPWSDDITLHTKGNMNLATIPIAMLDSIAINSGRSNTPIKQNLGLVGKESTFSGYSRPMTKKSINATEVQRNYVPNKYQVYQLVNNHRFLDGKYSDFIGAIDKIKYPSNYSKLTQKEKDKLTIDAEARAKYAVEHGTAENKYSKIYYPSNYLADAFMRYAANPAGYNSKQKNYVQMVNDIANEVWNEPQIQNWWNTEGINYYNKGKAEK